MLPFKRFLRYWLTLTFIKNQSYLAECFFHQIVASLCSKSMKTHQPRCHESRIEYDKIAMPPAPRPTPPPPPPRTSISRSASFRERRDSMMARGRFPPVAATVPMPSAPMSTSTRASSAPPTSLSAHPGFLWRRNRRYSAVCIQTPIKQEKTNTLWGQKRQC